MGGVCCQVGGAYCQRETLVTFKFVTLMVSAGQQGEKQTGQQNQDQRKSSAETKTTKQVSSQDNVLWPRPLLSLANS